MKQLVLEKENSEFKPVKLRLKKLTLCHILPERRGWVNRIITLSHFLSFLPYFGRLSSFPIIFPLLTSSSHVVFSALSYLLNPVIFPLFFSSYLFPSLSFLFSCPISSTIVLFLLVLSFFLNFDRLSFSLVIFPLLSSSFPLSFHFLWVGYLPPLSTQ